MLYLNHLKIKYTTGGHKHGEIHQAMNGMTLREMDTKIDKAQKHIRVKFAAGEKTFIFPDAFKAGFLKTK